MEIVWLTALGVGGATVLGAGIGFFVRRVSHRFEDTVLAFAAGVMLAAAVLGLAVPSVEHGIETFGLPLALVMTVGGLFAGAVSLTLVDRLVPHLHRLAGVENETHRGKSDNRTLLFVAAIAIHNLPEGIAAGVGFGGGNTAEALVIAGGIALQNIPEGMVIIAPMLATGIRPRRAFLIALGTGLFEVVGTLLGYAAVALSKAILPFALAFAAGTMLYVISDEMIPETHAHSHQRAATYALLLGFSLMLVMDVLLG